MPISFEMPESVIQQKQMTHAMAEMYMRSISREMDENEHTIPDLFVKNIWPVMRDMQAKSLQKALEKSKSNGGAVNGGNGSKPKRPSIQYLRLMNLIEELSWGDAGIYLCLPNPQLAGSAIEAVGTDEQKERFLRRFAEGDDPVWGAMCMTEPGAGSDTSSIKTTAVLDEETNEWVLNGEKIFVTSGGLALEESNGIAVVWATIDPEAGRAGMKPFVVEADTPGVTVTKQEIKHGIRASNTVAIVFDDARIPFDNILGSPEVKQKGSKGGFKGAMATFDASRPLVAASAIGIGRAAIELVKEKLTEAGIEIPYDKPHHKLTAVQRDVLEMEAQLKAARLLTTRAIVQLDQKQPNSLEASMCKVKAGKAVTKITQKAVEILGPLGYSREWLVEKWMRDGKINDIYEGTGQINTLIVARRILGYSSRELR
jgi:acyl-CoA dehydrogenase